MRIAAAIAILVLYILPACKQGKGPDVSDINIDIKVRRFENDFFAIDTNNLAGGLTKLQERYPHFLADFGSHILGLPPVTDSGTQVQAAIKSFLRDYRPIYDSVRGIFPAMEKERNAIAGALQYVKYYFPAYKTPSEIITFIGPVDAYFEASLGGYGDVITTDALAVGLQLHMGNTFSLYTSQMGQALYPTYISRRFTPEIKILLILVNIFAIASAVLFYFQVIQAFSFLVFSLLWFILMLVIWRILPRAIYNRSATFRDVFTMQLQESEAVLQTERGSKSWSWKSFSKFVETPYFFHLYFDSRSFFLVPKDAFRDINEIQEARKLFRNKIAA